MKRSLLFIPLLLAIALGLVLYFGLGTDKSQRPSALVGDPVPPFNLPGLADPGQRYTEAMFQGQITLLNVWGTWCPACRHEHPYLVSLARQLGQDSTVRLVGLNYKDTRDAAREWLRDLGNPYQQVVFDADGTLGFDLGVYGAPETFVIDADGVIRYRHVGIVNEQVWAETLQPLIQTLKGGS